MKHKIMLKRTPSKCGNCYDILAWMSWIFNIYHLRLQAACVQRKELLNTFNTYMLPCVVLKNSHLPCHTRNSLTIITMSALSIGMLCKVQHSSLVMHLMRLTPMPPLTKWWSLTSCRLPFISALWVAPAVLLYNTPVNMPCIGNDALPLKTLCPGSAAGSYS